MKLVKKTDSNRNFVKKDLYPLVNEVVKRLGIPKFREVAFLFTENPKEAFLDIANPERMYSGRRYDKMEYWLSESVSSFSVQEGNKVKIMINLKDPNIKNRGYATGLIAHEFMHTIVKSEGIEPRISEVGKKQWPFIIKTLERIGENYEQVLNDLVKLVTFFILCMKDLIVDTILIENGFEEEIFEHKRLASASGSKRIKVGRLNLARAMILYIGYNNMWIPFKLKSPKYLKELKRPFGIPDLVEKECKKVVKELEDVRPGVKNHEKEIREVVRAGLDAYRKMYRKLK
ncbi:MAG: hypothetical protein JSV92_02440 [archaeon]|nr:MAG: hypothetical protein JSV92_02440 [archaeon]